MGTNLYWRPAKADADPTEIHVGKSSAGWSFCFRGYRKNPLSVLQGPIASRRDWQAFFITRPGGTIVDEYGDDQGDPVAWVEALEPPSAAQRSKENALHYWGFYNCEWRDPEGFRFCDQEFC